MINENGLPFDDSNKMGALLIFAQKNKKSINLVSFIGWQEI